MDQYLKCLKCGKNSLVISYRSENQSSNEATISFLCVWCHDCDFIQEASAFYKNHNIDGEQQNKLHELLMQNGQRLGVPLL